MDRPIVDRSASDATPVTPATPRRRRSDKTEHKQGGWAAKVVVLPAAVVGLVNRILHREAQRPAPIRTARRRAGVYVWRQAIGPDGQPEGEGEIVPLPDAQKYRGSSH
ncbi:MAG TPA: hypothetical protein VFT29_05680 [Gemmatimonadaceae bacterium]|nr:hypothetical protein [Gemmatimonadaceae bacterium]